ncbi:MAG: hypothetical protein OZSIB_3540 [Candidatus Ozemobacter sibiricus]|uniref:LysM domain-containing protein n=1 Tax=Candidatus Ozemobacter sibiricus TaxID=2268124 RepID=A0A367ZPR2_9BACT|nr:MAG: hypothetical protein OZSIB_3540 [Candidatus Ozemobacter sibiricus]
MSTSHVPARPAPQRGLFLFFVVGLFLLQIAFAYTIHGDIGPQFPHPSGLERTAPEALIGHIDALLAPTPTGRCALRPRPDTAPAAASRKILDGPMPTAAPGAEPAGPVQAPRRPDPTQEQAGRFATYTIGRGDTLESIARKLYGSTRMVVHLVRLNRIRDERSLQQGDRLLVPRAGLLQPLSAN